MKCVVCRLYIYTPDTILNDLVLKCIIYATTALLCFRSAFILSLLDRGLSALKCICIIEAQLNIIIQIIMKCIIRAQTLGLGLARAWYIGGWFNPGVYGSNTV